jgi:hypothetical protein
VYFQVVLARLIGWTRMQEMWRDASACDRGRGWSGYSNVISSERVAVYMGAPGDATIHCIGGESRSDCSQWPLRPLCRAHPPRLESVRPSQSTWSLLSFETSQITTRATDRTSRACPTAARTFTSSSLLDGTIAG